MAFAPSDLSCDEFLGGKLNIWQPQSGYRAGADAVFLAASVAARPGQAVLELGCGVGVASLCLGCRVPGLQLTGVEIQPDYADLARKNALANSISLDVLTADLCDLPAEIRARNFDHVFANPPYFLRDQGTRANDPGRDLALAGGTSLALWLDIATRRLKPGGYLTMIQKTARLPDILSVADQRLGSFRVKPLTPRTGRASELVIIGAQKGGRAEFELLSPFLLHEGSRHTGDGDSYTAAAHNILRAGHALNFD